MHLFPERPGRLPNSAASSGAHVLGAAQVSAGRSIP